MTARSNLRRIADSNDFGYLQEKADRLVAAYNLNSNDENVVKCCEIIEVNAKLQRELFKVLNEIAAEGGLYSNARSLIRSRFYPYFYEDYYLSGSRAAALLHSSETLAHDLVVYESLARKNAEIEDLTVRYEKNLNELEDELTETKADYAGVKSELDFARDALTSEKRKATDDRLNLETENNELRAKLRHAEVKLSSYEPRLSLVDDYERQILLLKDEIRVLKKTNSILSCTSDYVVVPPLFSHRSRAESPVASARSSRSKSRSRVQERSRSRPSTPVGVSDVIRQENIISRFNTMYSKDRLDAMDILKVYCDDHENNQRVLYAVMQEAFSVAKIAFADWKLRVRANLIDTIKGGSESLEEAIQDYISRNLDLYDLPMMVTKVVNNLNYNSKVYLPVGVSYTVISSFIREACRLAWQMASLSNPLDVSFSLDAEVFDDIKYRRSYDSEFSAPLVNHHIWPCLLQGTRIVVKGEACTKRSATLSELSLPLRKSIIRARSISPRRYIPLTRSYTAYKYFY